MNADVGADVGEVTVEAAGVEPKRPRMSFTEDFDGAADCAAAVVVGVSADEEPKISASKSCVF